MNKLLDLNSYLSTWGKNQPRNNAIIETIQQIALASIELSAVLRQGELARDDNTVKTKQDGDIQISMDIIADDIFFEALQKAPVAVIASEETDAVRLIDKNAPLAVALDPLDGSSNVNVNMTVGTIFNLLPYQYSSDPELSFMQKGRHQLAAGFTLYGPQTLFVLTVGRGTQVFILDEKTNDFVGYQENLQIPTDSSEYAINASNQRHWSAPVREFIEACTLGTGGQFGKDFNTRWTASAVADVYRILSRGGVYLYPGDRRKDYEAGRLRLVYEANPIALLIEQAGGQATDGDQRILDIKPVAVHQHIPLVFGSAKQVEAIANYQQDQQQNQGSETLAPLFNKRGLFQ